MRQLYKKLDALQFKPDYMCLVIDKKKDYYRACKGFQVNGVRYVRLLGTNGGIKNSTIVFVSERLHDVLDDRIENGRDQGVPLVTAKHEAYRALTCSASIPVSFPRGVVVVNDAETSFMSEVLELNDESEGEPILRLNPCAPVKMNATDGCGLMMPELAERWGRDLRLRYTPGGVNVRFSWTKGMVCAFDFREFAERCGKEFVIKDAWGDDVDLSKTELVLTTSMVKLWDNYKSCAEFLANSERNGYTFGVAKVSPETLEQDHDLNYQFIQSYDLSDEDIEELITPTINDIKDALGADWRKTILYLKGAGLNEHNVADMEDDIVKAVMVDSRMAADPYIQDTVYKLIRRRINEAKVGVVKVHGNYSIVCGDPFLLCQHMFGLPLTGLLKAGEIYNSFWTDEKRLACFRAPMSTHSNIRAVTPNVSPEARYWYRYAGTMTVLNGWDTTCIALNGMDFDGDLVMLTDNDVLVRRLRELPALMCAQRKAEKRISAEEDFVASNIANFGNEIGQTTNWITSMYEVASHFDPESRERRTLEYRIQCGQLYQQNVIDRAKGIVAKPMPRIWHDRHSTGALGDPDERAFQRRIVADKKPYFMRYIYPPLMKQYNTYVKSADRNAMREFNKSIFDLEKEPQESLSDAEREFLHFYRKDLPVGTGRCVMNRICARIEEEFDSAERRRPSEEFDYRIMRDNEVDYTPRQLSALKRLYADYNRRLAGFSSLAKSTRLDDADVQNGIGIIDREFRAECDKICPNEKQLCNILLDLCYTRTATKRFAWSMCGPVIIDNLLSKNDRTIQYPAADGEGDIIFGGARFSVAATIIPKEVIGGNNTQ